LHEASAEIGVATADLFPSLTLGGTAGASNSVISQTLRAGTKFWSAQAALAGSLFSGGSQWYTRKAAIDAYDASLAQYENTVLGGLQQVADAMTALNHDAQALRAQVEALASASENVKLTRAGYEAGLLGYLDMLAADSQYQQARLGYVGAVAQRLQDTVALYAALGGGWWNEGHESASAAPATGPSAPAN
jgi:outer membrane protein TolC